MAASRCSELEIAEMDGQSSYRPATSLASAEQIRQRHGGELTDLERRTLNNKMHTVQLMQLVWERHNDDLDEYAAGCRANAERRRQSASDPLRP